MTQTSQRTLNGQRSEYDGHKSQGWELRSRAENHSHHDGEGLANGLGLVSIGLGLALLLAPRRVASLIGVFHNAKSEQAMRLVGLREIASGAAILMQRRPTGWVGGRIAGDVMDLVLLNRAMQHCEAEPGRINLAMAAVLGITGLDLVNFMQLQQSSQHGMGVQVEQSITVYRPIEEVYNFWRNFTNLPRIMQHLEHVQLLGDGVSEWKAKAPAGVTVEWRARMVEDRPNELIAWRSLEDADVKNAGSVRFAPSPDGQGTEVRVELRYDPPAGQLGKTIAKLLGEEPELQIADDLRAFKQVMETGEVLRSDGAVLGARMVHRPAQPRRLSESDDFKR